MAVKFRPEHPGLLLDMDTGEQLVTDLWPEDGGILALMDDGYVSHTPGTQDGATAFTYHELNGDPRQSLELPTTDGGHPRAYTLATPEALIAVHAGPDPSDDALVTFHSWDDGEQTASLRTTLSVSSDHGDGSAPTEQAAEQPRYLQAVPGAIAALDPTTGRVTAFVP